MRRTEHEQPTMPNLATRNSSPDESQTWEEDLFSLRANAKSINVLLRSFSRARRSYKSVFHIVLRVHFADIRIPQNLFFFITPAPCRMLCGDIPQTYAKTNTTQLPHVYRSMMASSLPRARTPTETSPYLIPGDFRCRSLSMTDGAARLAPMPSARSARSRCRPSATVSFLKLQSRKTHQVECRR